MVVWAFSCASMLRASTKLLIRRCFEIGLIDKEKMEHCRQYISEEGVHVELRNLILLVTDLVYYQRSCM